MTTLWWIGIAQFGAVIAWYVVDRERRQQKIVWYRALILVGLILAGALRVATLTTQSALLVYIVGLLVGTIGHIVFVGVIARRTRGDLRSFRQAGHKFDRDVLIMYCHVW